MPSGILVLDDDLLRAVAGHAFLGHSVAFAHVCHRIAQALCPDMQRLKAMYDKSLSHRKLFRHIMEVDLDTLRIILSARPLPLAILRPHRAGSFRYEKLSQFGESHCDAFLERDECDYYQSGGAFRAVDRDDGCVVRGTAAGGVMLVSHPHPVGVGEAPLPEDSISFWMVDDVAPGCGNAFGVGLRGFRHDYQKPEPWQDHDNTQPSTCATCGESASLQADVRCIECQRPFHWSCMYPGQPPFESDFMVEEGIVCPQCVDMNDTAATTTTSILWQSDQCGCSLAAFGKVMPWAKASVASSAAMGSEEVLPGAQFRRELARAAAGTEGNESDDGDDGEAGEEADDEAGDEIGWKPAYADLSDPLSRSFLTDFFRTGRMTLDGSRNGTHDRGIGFIYRPHLGSVTMHHPSTRRSFTVQDPLLERGSGWRWHITVMANLDSVGCTLLPLGVSQSDARGSTLSARGP